MKEYMITCPYCFARFKDDEVHFRMETFFKDVSELNEEGRDLDELEMMPETPKYVRMKAQTRNRRHFLVKDDEQYENFWRDFGRTTESPTSTDKDLGIDVWKLPVLNPGDKDDQNVLKEINHNETGKQKFLIRDENGMVNSVRDIFGRETRRRVCPKCHNPLPDLYGKHEVKFISIIGVTSSGKTVYISQLLKHLNRYCSYVKISATPLSNHEREFMRLNKVEQGTALPDATVPGTLAQPMFYQLQRKDENDRLVNNTIVLQDIAGEAFREASFLRKYGRFVTKSDGIILILDPNQLRLIAGQTDSDDTPTLVLETIHNAFVGDNDQPCNIPIAVCVSKSDIFAPGYISLLENDISPVTADDGEILPVFNSVEYNQLEPQIKRLMNSEVNNMMELQYRNYNYFAFSATGCGVERREDNAYHLVAPASPKRIAEPILWLLHQFGYIKSDIPILLPKPRKAPNGGIVGTGQYTKLSIMDRLAGKKPEEIMREMTPEEKEQLKYENSSRAIRRR